MTFIEPGRKQKLRPKKARQLIELYKRTKTQHHGNSPGFFHQAHSDGVRGLEALPGEILQTIFVISGNLSLPECSRILFQKLAGSQSLRRRMLSEFVDDTNRLPSWLMDRRFVTQSLMRKLKIKGLTTDDGQPIINTEPSTSRKFEIMLYLWEIRDKSVDLSTLVLTAVKRDDYDTVVDIFNTLEAEMEAQEADREDGEPMSIDRQITLDHRALIASFENDNADMARLLMSRKLIDLNDVNIWHYIAQNKSWTYYKMLTELGAIPPLSSV